MLTKDLDIPNKPSEQPQGWFIRRLLSLGGSVGKVVSTFNPFEFIFFVMILLTGAAELLGRDVSWVWYVLVFILLFLGFVQRNRVELPKKEDKPTEVKK